jgi:alpha-beta hydrolase superfamily lysophospholipase
MKLLILLLVAVYVLICVLLFFFQEKIIFFPEKLSRQYKFDFGQPFEEIKIETRDEKRLHGGLFRADSSKGLIFYLHGNAGSLATWGYAAKTYTDLGYDVFIVDYRGFGKSEGIITSQQQFYEDLQIAYDQMKARYPEEKIVILGYSIGTGPAAKIASLNKPKLLILQAPYYSMKNIMKRHYPIIPTFILKYKFETNEYISTCRMPIVLIHGKEDEVIPYRSSLMLKEIMKKTDTVIILEGQSHNGMTDNPEYQREIKKLLKL